MGTMVENTGRDDLIGKVLDLHAGDDSHEKHALSIKLARLSYGELKRRYERESRQ